MKVFEGLSMKPKNTPGWSCPQPRIALLDGLAAAQQTDKPLGRGALCTHHLQSPLSGNCALALLRPGQASAAPLVPTIQSPLAPVQDKFDSLHYQF